ncbi:hypothetical protein SAMN05421820_101434 [Pedobacter steynii]|uniref:Clindamycin resistance transfer factor btgA n=1 Tax=Pedobacter steynii TaxID=430522 RepID=A0A1G9K2L1_9SPHI|nr:BfmA/BtgA family mobilization protein [Pedobacter steynii]NQX38414.1 hypothetical protein [Pedobacter steynii]SDL43453.1 hypothetical protein SAMN05421820_101434 [Pedobacter steynii]
MEVESVENFENLLNMKTVKFSQKTDERFVKISHALGRSRRELFSQMVDYFYKNKKDPTDLNDDALKSTLVRSHKTYVGFIKNQEDLLLIPMKEAMDKMITNQKDIVRFFNEQVIGANKSILKHQLEQVDKFAATDQLMKVLKEQMETKAKLKVKMLQILNGYIKAREELGSFKAKEKEELADRVRNQVESL